MFYIGYKHNGEWTYHGDIAGTCTTNIKDSYENDKPNGSGCMERIMKNGWKIDY